MMKQKVPSGSYGRKLSEGENLYDRKAVCPRVLIHKVTIMILFLYYVIHRVWKIHQNIGLLFVIANYNW